MHKVLTKSGGKVPILCEILTDLERPEPLEGRKIVARLKDYGYRCLDATHLRPIDRNSLGFEENILCLYLGGDTQSEPGLGAVATIFKTRVYS